MPYAGSGPVTLWWDENGSGPGRPLLLVQGLGYTAEMWGAFAPELAAERRVVRFDNRGVGRSEVPAVAWTLEEMADDAVAVLDAAGVDVAHVLGVSMGGVIAQEIALRHPDRVAGLVLGCTHPGGRDAVRMDRDAAAMLLDTSPKTHREAIEASLPFNYPADTDAAVIARDVEARLRFPLRAKGYRGQLDAMRHHGGTFSRLPAVRASTVVLHGTADALVKPGNAELLAGAIPGARLVWIQGAGHVFWTVRTTEALAAVRPFLAEADAAIAD